MSIEEELEAGVRALGWHGTEPAYTYSVVRIVHAAIAPLVEARTREELMMELSAPAPHYRSYVDGNHCKACSDYVARKESDD